MKVSLIFHNSVWMAAEACQKEGRDLNVPVSINTSCLLLWVLVAQMTAHHSIVRDCYLFPYPSASWLANLDVPWRIATESTEFAPMWHKGYIRSLSLGERPRNMQHTTYSAIPNCCLFDFTFTK